MATFDTAEEGAATLAQCCDNARQTRTGWQVCCPAHEDTTPSLSLTPTTDRILLRCHAGCTAEAIVAALGLTMADLFVGVPDRRRPPSPAGPPRVTATYPYHAADGHMVFEVVRYTPKAFRQRRPDPTQPDAWIWNLRGVTRVLYHLPDVLQAVAAGAPVYLCEGEHDSNTVRALGLTATTNAGGAGKWEAHYTETLRGADVVLLPDNDAPGRAHAVLVAQALHGVAARVRVLALPGVPPKGDVSDWLEAGGTRAQLEALVAQTPLWTPELARPQEPAYAERDGQHRPPGRQGEAAPAPRPDEPPLPYSDYTNALALVRDHGQDLRYCWPWRRWLVWTGTHWQEDATGAVRQQAKRTLKRLARHAEDLEDAGAQALMAHLKKSLSTAAIKAMIEGAQDEPGMPVLPEHLDTNPWLLNCPNGTLDLQTGTLQPHARDDLLTRCIPVAYDAEAACPTWDTFLDQIMAGNQNLLRFLQRAVGYALTGVIREHVLPILWGKGRNGKSTLLNALRALLGPYALKAPSELLLVSHNERHPTERADLFGKRFVAAIETEQGRRLAEVFVKEATGGDPIRARRMREDFWEFWPTHKVFLATNHKPVITGTDNAIWERIRLIPFVVTIPSSARDTTLADKLQAELPGILAWAVRGCLAWQRDGLGEPEEVQQATAGYRTEMDVLGAFLEECCFVRPGDPRVLAKASALYKAYQDWCTANGDHALVQRNFGMQLTERGFERQRGTGGAYWWHGIGLQTPTCLEKGTARRSDDSAA